MVLALGLTCKVGAEESLSIQKSQDGNGRQFKHYSLEELMAVEVSAATKSDLTIREAPAIGDVITREKIDAYGWSTLRDVLLRQVGFAPSQDYERVTISSRGQYESWNNNHLRLLINGIPSNNATNGTAYVWEMMPLSMVESIEILRGPGSALYGSNATNGVIAIHTRSVGEEPEVQGAMTMGNEGMRALRISGGASNPWVRLFSGYQYHVTDGNEYDSYDASRRLGTDGRFLRLRVNDRHSTHAAFLQAEGKGAFEGLSLQATGAFWHFQTAQGWLYRIPDELERAYNQNGLLSLGYKPSPMLDDRLQLEFATSWQSSLRDYRIKLLPDSATFLGTPLPDGLSEALIVEANDLFARLQADYRIIDEARALVGIENTLYFSQPNAKHESNVDLNRGGTLKPFDDGQMHELRPTSEMSKDYPIENLGLFLQLTSGRILRGWVSATAGIRYDLIYAQYLDLDQPSRPLTEKFLDQTSPRLGLVVFPTENLSVKFLAEKAFRAPAPSELFSINSLLGFSNPGPLEAESMTAYTLAVDWSPFRHLNLRVDGFIQKFENQIAYSGSKNYTSNVYTRTLNGVESALSFDAEIGAGWALSGFANHTLSHLLSETVLEPAILKSSRLTWAPEHVANAGCLLTFQGLSLSIQAHYQGTVYRRNSDYQGATGEPTVFSAYRPRTLDSWVTLDACLAYRFEKNVGLKLSGTNILDEQGFLMKPGDYPFDFQIEGAKVQLSLEYSLGGSRTTPSRRPIGQAGI